MNIYLIVCLAVLNAVALKASKVLVALYAIELGANPFAIGVVISMYAVFPLLLAVYAGRVSDRLGVRLPMLFGSTGLSIGLLCPYLVPQLASLYVSAAIVGMSFVFFHVSVHNLVGSLGDAETRTRNFSTFSLGAALSGFLGPLFAGFSIDHMGHAPTYLYLSLFSILPASFLLLFPQLFPKTKVRHDDETVGSGVVDLFRHAPLRRTFITSGMILTGIDLYLFYFPIYGRSIGLSASLIGIVLSMYAVAAFVVRVGMPALVRRSSEETVLTYSLFVAGATYLLFPFFENVYVLGIISFVLGLGLGCGQPLSIILTYNRAPAGRSGEALGVRIMVNKITQIVVPIFFGSIGSVFGMVPVFWSNAAFLASSGYLNRARDKQPRAP
jgi:MFS family permease